MMGIELKQILQGIKEAPERLRKKVAIQGTSKVLEYAEQEMRRTSPSKVLAGSMGGRGGIAYQVIERGKHVQGVLSLVARDRRSGYNYARALVEGTGVYGPKKKRIRPIRAKILAWMSDGSENPTTAAGWARARKAGLAIYAKSTAGRKKHPFAENAWKAAMKKASEIFQERIKALNRSVK